MQSKKSSVPTKWWIFIAKNKDGTYVEGITSKPETLVNALEQKNLSFHWKSKESGTRAVAVQKLEFIRNMSDDLKETYSEGFQADKFLSGISAIASAVIPIQGDSSEPSNSGDPKR